MAAEKKMARHERLYKKKPHLERDEDGNMAVKESEKEAEKVQSGTDGVAMTEHEGEGMPMHVRHSMDRHHAHAKHETEHTMHDHHGSGSKAELHSRHEKEMKDLHKRHESEIEAGEKKDQDIKGNKAGEAKEKKSGE